LLFKGWLLAGNLYTGYQDIQDISRISEVYKTDIKRKLTKFQLNISVRFQQNIKKNLLDIPRYWPGIRE